jgi:hypothetical protein
LPQSPLVPEGSLPVSAALGEPQNVAAVGIVLPSGMDVIQLAMTLAVTPDGQSNDGQAALQACPITSFWGPAEGGTWEDRPKADCERAAKGERNDDGSWTFDLTSMASDWVGQPSNGVLLTEASDAPATFQVAFAGLPDGIRFEADLQPASSDGGFALGGTGFGGTATGSSESPAIDVGALPAPSLARGEAEAAPVRRSPARTVAALPRQAGHVLGNLPLGMALLLPLALLLAAALLQTVTGPARPARTRRQGGVGRSLAARSLHRPSQEPT